MSETLFGRTVNVLYGENITTGAFALAGEFGIDARTIERWLSGKMYPPSGVWRELLTRVRDLGAQCEELEREIERRLVP